MFWLHERLADRSALEHTQKRFEALRGYRLLPRGRQNAGVRLSDEQIASAILGFAHPLPAYAGHASLILGNLRPVGGMQASFRNEPTLRSAVANLVGDGGTSSDLLRLTLSIERDFHDEEYAAQVYFHEEGCAKVVSFVSQNALSLLGAGAEAGYDHNRLDKISAAQRSFGSKFFRDLAKTVSISRQLNRPLKTDWREYEAEEEKAEFHARLGARPSSCFLNLRVDAQVTWPKEPTRIEFDGHNLVLFPKTKENSHSISIDLAHERISADQARSLINRFLSIMSWCDDQPASLHEGWSGNPVPVPVSRQNLAFITAHEWHFNRRLPDDEKLKMCLAYYRDGLNAFSVGLASHAVLSFYRVIETKLSTKKRAIEWINDAFEGVKNSNVEDFRRYEEDRKMTCLGHGEYIYKKCRVATAHAAEDAPSDPDGTGEARRLLNAARVIKQLARNFIKDKYNFSESYFEDDSE